MAKSNEENSPGSIKTRILGTRRSKQLLVLGVLAIGVTGFVSASFEFHLFGLGSTSCVAIPTNAANSAFFTVTMSANGYNDSKIFGLPRPVMNVTLGEKVTIHIVNNDPTESHGFVITHYFETGLILRPGQCHDLTLTASLLGNFRVFCQIFCVPHIPWMQDGEFNVNP